jgi:hypothetical protein
MTTLRDRINALDAARTETLAALSGLSVADLERPALWRGHAGAFDVRFLLLQLADADDERRVRLRHALDLLGWQPSMTQQILAGLVETRGRLLGALVHVSDDQLDTPPAAGEWTLREVLDHMMVTVQRYTVHTRHAVERGRRIARGEEGGPLRPPDSALPALNRRGLAAGGLADVRRLLTALRDETIDVFVDLTDADLSAPTDWLGIEWEVRFRLHRFAAHERQHLVQIEKTLDAIAVRPSEAQRILAEAELARAQLTALTVGLPDEVAQTRPDGERRSVLDWLVDAEAGEGTLRAEIASAIR